ncbi:hypothetical protein [Streptomyces xanthophaeus]|uniref:hypothetical protein n=1 Tax=Streptomyces xanthophaeus TaxID=67385 RepID=UPI00264833BB|nr:hypothetical protein [Streptomyces xanthophaeus]WKD31228.1 hypothetical protein KO717_04125 [Streptomyces xanthophaeus]
MASSMLVLDDAPLPDHAVIAELELVSQDDSRGAGRDEPVGRVSLGHPQVSRLALADGAARLGVPDPNRWDLIWVRWPYTVHEPAAGFQHTRVKVGFDLGISGSRAVALCPRDVTSQETVSRAYGLTPTLTFGVVEVGADVFTHQVSFIRLTPVITAYGEGEGTFYWVYSPATERAVHPGTKHSIAVLQVPTGSSHLDMAVGAEVELRRRWLGRWRPGRAASNLYGARLELADPRGAGDRG